MAARYPPTLGITGFDGGTKPAIALATRRSLVDSGGVEGGDNPPPPEETGACCADDGSCSITTDDGCDGTYQGDGTVCDPNPCAPTGACCVDSDCSITTEDDCTGMGGTYQGDDTVCDPNPCSPTGACCADDGTCTITTEADCTGTYQGDDTVCDPNPCPQPCNSCGYDGFLGIGNKYLTQTTEYVWDQTRGAPFPDCTSHFDHITGTTCDPLTGDSSLTCSGGGSHTGDFDPDYTWTWEYSSILGACHCVGIEGCNPCSVSSCPSCDSGDTIVSDTVKYCTCHTTSLGFTADLLFTTTLSDPCVP